MINAVAAVVAAVMAAAARYPLQQEQGGMVIDGECVEVFPAFQIERATGRSTERPSTSNPYAEQGPMQDALKNAPEGERPDESAVATVWPLREGVGMPDRTLPTAFTLAPEQAASADVLPYAGIYLKRNAMPRGSGIVCQHAPGDGVA